MPPQRKPLIPPGSVLPEAATGSLMDRVIDRDRERSGRRTIPEGEVNSDASEKDTYNDSNVASNKTSEQHSNEATQQPSVKATKRPRYDTSKAASERAALIDSMRATPLSQLNIRIPDGFNDWLEEEAHRGRKEKVTKQSLVTEAIAEFIIRRMGEAEEGDKR